MGDKIDMSLDDIIKTTKKTRAGRVGGRGGGGRRGGSSLSAGGGHGTNKGGRGASRLKVKGGGVQQRRGTRKVTSRANSTAYQRTKQLPEVQQHDMYKGGKRGAARRLPGGRNSQGGLGGGEREGGKLLVSNLEVGVDDGDIQELFAEFGKLRKSAVHYDRSGRSLGTAEVIFEMKSAAVKASKQRNNVSLDGRAMNIQLVVNEDDAPAAFGKNSGGGLQARRIGNRRGSFGGRSRGGGSFGGVSSRGGLRNTRGGDHSAGGGRGRGGGGARGRGRGGAKAETHTKDELDAQLDAYTSKVDT